MATKSTKSSSRSTKGTAKKNVLIVGVTRTVGRKVAQILMHDKYVDKVVGVAKEEMPYYFADLDPRRFFYYSMDILKYRELNNFFNSDLYKRAEINTVLHLAHVADPAIYTEKSHHVNVAGTRNILERCVEDRNIKKFIFLSGAEVYKLKGDNDVLITEENELNFDPDAHPLIQDYVNAELLCRSKSDTKGMDMVILRPSGIIGRNIRSDLNMYLESNICATVLGYNPMINPIHSRDVITAIRLVIGKKVHGAFNLGGKDIAPVTTWLRMAKKPYFPVPSPFYNQVNKTLRRMRMTRYDSSVNPLRLQFSCILDYSKATKTFGWTPQEHVKFD